MTWIKEHLIVSLFLLFLIGSFVSLSISNQNINFGIIVGALIPLIVLLPLLINKIPSQIRTIYGWLLFVVFAAGTYFWMGPASIIPISIIPTFVFAQKVSSVGKENIALRRLYIALALAFLFIWLGLPIILGLFKDSLPNQLVDYFF